MNTPPSFRVNLSAFAQAMAEQLSKTNNAAHLLDDRSLRERRVTAFFVPQAQDQAWRRKAA